MLLDKVRKTINENNLLDYGDSVICAVSGGADSVCLLYVMQALKSEYNLKVYVANVNHLLRGVEAARDSNFVKSICKAADIEMFYREYDIKKIAKEKRIGEEECGRVCRYEFFQELSEKLSNAKIATAHNLNDNAETILFRLVRGAGGTGLSGIKYKRDNIIRPLLDVKRSEIESYLKRNGITWCEDSTNRESVYARNKIRNTVLPVLNQISNNACQKIVNASYTINEDEKYFSEITQFCLKECFFDSYIITDKIASYPNPIKRRVVSEILSHWKVKEVSFEKIHQFIEFLSKESGKQFVINSISYAEKSYDKIYFRKREEENNFQIIIDDCTSIKFNEFKLDFNIYDKLPEIKGNNIVAFDGDKLKFPLKVRYRKDGDKLKIKGLEGSKKVSNILTDEKVERYERDRIPIIEKDDDIIYLCGLRQSELYGVSDFTQRYLVISYAKER